MVAGATAGAGAGSRGAGWAAGAAAAADSDEGAAGAGDSDTGIAQCAPARHQRPVDQRTDQFANETSWSVIDSDGTSEINLTGTIAYDASNRAHR